MHQFSYPCQLKSEAGKKAIGTAEWQHGHKTVPETFSHSMTHSAQARTLHGSSIGRERISKQIGHSSLLRQDKLSGATGGLGQPAAGSVIVADAMT